MAARGDYAAKLYVRADSPEPLQRNVVALSGPNILDLSEQAETDEVRQHDAVLAWLCQHPGWLLIVDNIDSEETAAAVKALLPKLAGGHVLLTSRLRNWSGSVLALPLGELSPEAAIQFCRPAPMQIDARRPTIPPQRAPWPTNWAAWRRPSSRPAPTSSSTASASPSTSRNGISNARQCWRGSIRD